MRAKPAKILLIEDNPDDSRLIRAALAKADTPFVVRSAEQLSEAEHQLKCFHFQAVLADLALPIVAGSKPSCVFERRHPMFRSWCSPAWPMTT